MNTATKKWMVFSGLVLILSASGYAADSYVGPTPGEYNTVNLTPAQIQLLRDLNSRYSLHQISDAAYQAQYNEIVHPVTALPLNTTSTPNPTTAAATSTTTADTASCNNGAGCGANQYCSSGVCCEASPMHMTYMAEVGSTGACIADSQLKQPNATMCRFNGECASGFCDTLGMHMCKDRPAPNQCQNDKGCSASQWCSSGVCCEASPVHMTYVTEVGPNGACIADSQLARAANSSCEFASQCQSGVCRTSGKCL